MPVKRVMIHVLALLTLVVSSVGSVALVAAQDDATPDASAGAGAEPTVQSVECPFDATAKEFPKDLKEGENVACGGLQVPMDHSDPGGTQIALFLVAIASTSDTPAPEPIVMLAGGPGQGGSLLLPLFSADVPAPAVSYAPLLKDHNVILVDQRGTGFSEPSLACPAEIELAQGTPVATPAGGNIVDQGASLFADCDEALTDEGVNLNDFSTEQSAADLESLRLAVGADKLNLFGTSYGTWLAQQFALDFPDSVNNMVLGSPVPLEEYLFSGQLIGFNGALDEVFAGCAADTQCNQAFPDLDTQFSGAVAKLAGKPLNVPVEDPSTGKKTETPLDANTFLLLTYQMTFIGPFVPYVSPFIAAVNGGDGELAGQIASIVPTGGGGTTQGLFFAVICQDEAPFSTLDKDLAAAREAGVRPELLEAGPVVQTATMYEVCADWKIPASDPVANEPVISDVPSLIITGTFDPITPPSYGEVLAGDLSNSTLVNIPIAGHDPVTTSGECPISIVVAFESDPAVELDTSCVDDLTMDFFPDENATPEATPQS